jgi:tubulin beta
MGTKYWEVVCDEHGIGGDGEYCGDNDAQLDRINVLYHETSSGKFVPRAVFSNLEHGVIDAARALPLGELFRPGNLMNENAGAGKKMGQGSQHIGWTKILLNPL